MHIHTCIYIYAHTCLCLYIHIYKYILVYTNTQVQVHKPADLGALVVPLCFILVNTESD